MTEPVFDLLPGDTLSLFDGEGRWVDADSESALGRVRVEFNWSGGTLVHLDPTDRDILVKVKTHGPLKTAAIAELLGRTYQAIGKNLAKLVKAGLLINEIAGYSITPLGMERLEAGK